MSNVADARINTFGSKPPEADFVPPDDPILEIPFSDLQGLLSEMLCTYNQIAEMVRDAGILRGRELARVTESHSKALMAEKSPITKMLLLNAYIRQHLNRIREALKSQSSQGGKVVQVVSKIAARAVLIIDHIKSLAGRDVSLDSSQARLLFAGKERYQVSRRDTIRAMQRAEKLWPALQCNHRPGDGRQTMRITAKKEDIQDILETDYRSYWQRCGKTFGLSI